jgi:hypothetical protein
MFTVTHDAVVISGQLRQVRTTVISIDALYIYIHWKKYACPT